MSTEIYSGNPQLKRAHVAINFTGEQVDEWIKCAKDPVYFAKKYIKIISVDEGIIPFKMYKFQEKLINKFHKNRFNICKLPRQPLCLKTPIATTTGWKTIKDIKVGDYVYNPQGTPVEVIKKSETYYNTNCYKIFFNTGEFIISDEKHRWVINYNDSKKEILETHQIYNKFINNNILYVTSSKIPTDYEITDKNSPINKKHIIINVEKVESTPVACITVDDETHLFSCGKNFIPTHNSGKSTTTVTYLLHYALFNSDVNIAILANKAQTAKDLLARLQLAYENLPKWMQHGVKIWNKASLELDNGSRIIAASTSASSVRGGTYNIIFLDEFAFIPNQIAEEFFRSTYPTVTSGKETKVIIVSCVVKDTYVLTPKGYCKINNFIVPSQKGAYHIQDYTVYGMDGWRTGNLFYNNGKTTTKIIKTKYGELECSLEHKLWACKNGIFGWYKAKDLSNSDYISMKYNTQIFGNNDIIDFISKENKKFSYSTINPSIAYFLGLIIAKGAIKKINDNSKNEKIIIASENNQILNVLNELKIIYEQYDDKYYSIDLSQLIDFLNVIEFNFKDLNKHKVIPERLFSLSKENTIALIKGIFDVKPDENIITYSSTSKELIQQIHLLLANLGILGLIKHNKDEHIIEITNFQYYSLVENNIKENCNSYVDDIIPYSYNFLTNNSNSDNQIFDFFDYNTNHIPRNLLLKFKKDVYDRENQLIQEFLDNNVQENLIWCKIESIEISENEVYDFSLPSIDGDIWDHSVLYNNIVGHQTPKGMNMYYKLWTEAERGQNEYIPTEVSWNEVPGRDKKFKDQTIANIGLDAWNQEFECSFLGSAGTLISASKLKTLVHDTPISRNESLDIYKQPDKNRIYLIIVDCSEGVGKDYHAFIVFDITTIPYTIVAKFKNNELKPMLLADLIKRVATVYNEAYILIEIASVGEQVAKNVHYDLEYGNLLMSMVNGRAGQMVGQNLYGKNSQYGLKISKQVKRIGCSNLKTIIEDDKLLIRDFEIINELTTYISKNNSYEAEVGTNDDLVSCLVIFAWFIVQDYFKDITNNDIRKKISEEQKENLDLELAPLGFFNDGILNDEDKVIDNKTGDVWVVADKTQSSSFDVLDFDPLMGTFNYWYR